MADNQECICDRDEENRTACWLKYITALADLSHLAQDRLPEEAVNALDALMEDYRCNGPTVASQQVQAPFYTSQSASHSAKSHSTHCYCRCPC